MVQCIIGGMKGDIHMGFFNKDLVDGLLGRGYYCSICGEKMFFENEYEETLICPNCGHETPLERYGAESDEDYEAMYPSKEEVVGYDEE